MKEHNIDKYPNQEPFTIQGEPRRAPQPLGDKRPIEAAPAIGQHTTGTWKESPSGGIAADGEVIISGTIKPSPFNDGFGHAAGNRAFICRAVNSHADLLDAAKAARDLLIGELKEPKRTVFWKLVDAIKVAEGRAA